VKVSITNELKMVLESLVV